MIPRAPATLLATNSRPAAPAAVASRAISGAAPMADDAPRPRAAAPAQPVAKVVEQLREDRHLPRQARRHALRDRAALRHDRRQDQEPEPAALEPDHAGHAAEDRLGQLSRLLDDDRSAEICATLRARERVAVRLRTSPARLRTAYFRPTILHCACALHLPHRRCSPACGPPPSSGSKPASCRSKSTSRSACRRSRWSGLPDASVRESRDRVRSAIRNSGFEFPPHRITVNLAPADIRKAGSSFDLPIALGVLAAAGHITRRDIADVLLLGELSLDGGIQTARGVLPIAAAARRHRCHALLLPHPNSSEAAVVEGLELYPVRSLAEAVAALNDPVAFRASPAAVPPAAPPTVARLRRRLRRRPRAGAGAARARDRRRRRPQRADGRTARRRQDDDGAARRDHPAAADVRRGARGDVDPLRRRTPADRHAAAGRAAVPRAASHDLGRGARRRRAASAARRDQPRAPRRALPRRDAGVQPARARSAAPAARRGLGADRAGGAHGGLPRAVHADRRDEPVPVRVPRRPGARLPVLAAAGRALRVAPVRAAARSARPDRAGRRASRRASCRTPGPANRPKRFARASAPRAAVRWRATGG